MILNILSNYSHECQLVQIKTIFYSSENVV